MVFSLTSSAILLNESRFVDVVRDLIDDKTLPVAIWIDIFDADHGRVRSLSLGLYGRLL